MPTTESKTQTGAGHTPPCGLVLPLRLEPFSTRGGGMFYVMENSGRILFAVGPGPGFSVEIAAYMIRCVNAHEALADACSSAAQIIEQLIPEPSARGVADVVLHQLRAAPALANGGEAQ